jgi:hypothetical protein
VLRGGKRVAVKVQRPDIRERIVEDLEALRELAAFLDRHSSLGERYDLAKTVDAFGNSLLAELDYRREAQNLIVLRKNLEDFDRIYVPKPIDDYSTSRVLTMEYVDGRKVTDIDPMTRLDLDGSALATQLFEGVSPPGRHRRLLPRRSAPRQRAADRGPAARDAGSRHDRASAVEHARHAAAAVDRGGRGRAARRSRTARSRWASRGRLRRGEFRRRVSLVVGDFAQTRLADLQIGLVLIAVSRVAGETGDPRSPRAVHARQDALEPGRHRQGARPVLRSDRRDPTRGAKSAAAAHAAADVSRATSHRRCSTRASSRRSCPGGSTGSSTSCRATSSRCRSTRSTRRPSSRGSRRSRTGSRWASSSRR